jgi:hypothetical protein
MLKQITHRRENVELSVCRDSNGKVVDVVVGHGTHKTWIEIKTSYTFKPGMVKPMEGIMGQEDVGILLYQGEEVPGRTLTEVQNYKAYFADEA